MEYPSALREKPISGISDTQVPEKYVSSPGSPIASIPVVVMKIPS
jgi:hypothetical protein